MFSLNTCNVLKNEPVSIVFFFTFDSYALTQTKRESNNENCKNYEPSWETNP